MHSFFDLTRYRGTLFSDSWCPGCNRLDTACEPTAATRKQFREMTGLTWPVGLLLVTLPLRRDLACLGLDKKGVPATIPLCAGCALHYMREFNRLAKNRP